MLDVPSVKSAPDMRSISLAIINGVRSPFISMMFVCAYLRKAVSVVSALLNPVCANKRSNWPVEGFVSAHNAFRDERPKHKRAGATDALCERAAIDSPLIAARL